MRRGRGVRRRVVERDDKWEWMNENDEWGDVEYQCTTNCSQLELFKTTLRSQNTRMFYCTYA